MNVAPYLFYESVGPAAEWLQTAFGFSEVVSYRDDRDDVTYAELSYAGSPIMVGRFGRHYRNPKSTGYVSQLVFVQVDDVDAHFARAVAAGATILEPVSDKPYGMRQYTAEDPEGHRWAFGQPVRDVSPEEMKRVSLTS
jgi:uncharacterized glyoxalase superfamily protein PhnB